MEINKGRQHAKDRTHAVWFWWQPIRGKAVRFATPLSLLAFPSTTAAPVKVTEKVKEQKLMLECGY